jgi:hypothetical protein
MTTIKSHKVHTQIAKIIRSFGIDAKCVNNKDFNFNNYEVRVKGASKEEIFSLTNMMMKKYNNLLLNIVSC